MRLKALAEIYTMHSFAPFSNLNFFVKNCGFFCWTSPFRDRVAKLRGPSEGLGGNAANVWSTQLQAVEQWGAMWYFHITSTRDIFLSEQWRSSQMKIVLAVWKMQTPCCHVSSKCVPGRSPKSGVVVRWKYVAILILSSMLTIFDRLLKSLFGNFTPICGYNCCKVRVIRVNLEQFSAIFGNFMQSNFMQFQAI